MNASFNALINTLAAGLL